MAALLVALAHASMYAGYAGLVPLGGFLGFGTAGVDFFFVLSGFVIAHAHRADLGRPDQIPRYAWRRFVRVYPPYWIATVLTLVAIAAMPAIAPPNLPWSAAYMVKNFALAPMQEYNVVAPAWSLEYEVAFYVLFSALLIGRTFGLCVLGAWALLIVTSQFVAMPFPVSFAADPMNAEFLLGVAIALTGARAGWKTLAAGLLLLALSAIAQTQWTGALHDFVIHPAGRRVAYGVTSALIILAAIGFDIRSRVAEWMGRLSYPLYLVHFPIMTGLAVLAWHPQFMVACYVGVSVVAAVAFHIAIESPLLTWLQALQAKRAQARVIPAARSQSGWP